MNPKAYEKLVHVNYSANNPVTSRMVAADFAEYQSPAARLHHLALHGWGVASGLEVTATADATGLQVAAGVAIATGGQVIVLPTDGAGLLGDTPPLTETPAPVVVPAASLTPLAGKKIVVTIQFQETLRQVPVSPGGSNDFPAGKLEQTPWVRVFAAEAFAPSDDQVVLALADVGNDGKVTGVVSAASGVAPGRRRISTAVGELRVERPALDSAKEVTMGVVGPLGVGNGLQITAEVTALTGKVGVGQTAATHPLDVVGSAAVRGAAGGSELVVLSKTPDGGGGVETRDANGNRMVALTTTGRGIDQSGYVAVGMVDGPDEVVSLGSSFGAGQVIVNTNTGEKAVVIDGCHINNGIHMYSNGQEAVTIGLDGVLLCGEMVARGHIITTSGYLIAPSGLWCGPPPFGQGSPSGDVHCRTVVTTNGLQTAIGLQVLQEGQLMFNLCGDPNGDTSATFFNKSGRGVASLCALSNGAGALYVRDENGANLHVLDGKGPKNFVMTHPNDGSKDIVYACIEGPEAAAYIRGRATLKEGQARIHLPEHFSLVINADTVTIQLTARSAKSKGIAVVESGPDAFTVQELFGGAGSYDFDYFVAGVRKGYEHYQPVVAKGYSPMGHQIFRPDSPTPRLEEPPVSPPPVGPTPTVAEGAKPTVSSDKPVV